MSGEGPTGQLENNPDRKRSYVREKVTALGEAIQLRLDSLGSDLSRADLNPAHIKGEVSPKLDADIKEAYKVLSEIRGKIEEIRQKRKELEGIFKSD